MQIFTPSWHLIFCTGKLSDVLYVPPWRLIPRQIQPQKTVGKSRALKLLTLNSTADKLISGNDERRNRLRVLLIISLASLFVFWPSLGKTQEESLVLYFSFDKGVQDEIQDLSVHQNNGKISGNPKWDKGEIGKALTFNGTDDQVVVPTSESLDIKSAITMMAWVNPGKNLLEDWRTIIGKSPTNVLGQATFAYNLRTDKSGTYRFSLNMGGWQKVVGPNAEIGKWTHVANTYDGKTMVLYLNGDSVGDIAAKGKINVIPDPVGIGNVVDAGGAGKNEYWAGLLDEVKIWNRALSLKEVKEQMDFTQQDILAVRPKNKLATIWGQLKQKK